MLPIQTERDGDRITKVVVEDFYRVINRVQESMDRAYNKSIEILDSINKEYEAEDGTYVGELIIGRGNAKPHHDDTFNEEVGNEIAFRKAKINAAKKKASILDRIMYNYENLYSELINELQKVWKYVPTDLEEVRKYNPKFEL